MPSPLQKLRLQYRPKLPKILQHIAEASISSSKPTIKLPQEIISLFPKTHQKDPLEISNGQKRDHRPLRVGVVLSGGQAPGGHNVISGLFDALKALNPKSTLFGFLNGPSGIVENEAVEITEPLLAPYRNQGGFDIIGSGRTKIETPAQFQAAEKTVRSLNLDGLVIVGGDDSNTNAALLAEYFTANQCQTRVIGVPKTIDGDLKNETIEISFGFDTACKNYAATIGSLMRDALSAKKYYYFIKLMGRSASHITLECALQTHPNLALISEEIAADKTTLADIVDAICGLIAARAEQGKDYGIILIPEGVVEFVPEVKALIEELNALLAASKPHHAAIDNLSHKDEKIAYAANQLSVNARACFETLPKDIQAQLLIGRDAHGNVQVSKIETERMLIDMVKTALKERSKKGAYKGKFSPQPHFCGYEGRSCLPSNFDSQYCYALGHTAAILIDNEATGYICYIKDLEHPVEEWRAGGLPLTQMMTLEKRHGEAKPVIQKALVDLKGKSYGIFKAQSKQWMLEDSYLDPGPIQFFGPPEVVDAIPITLHP